MHTLFSCLALLAGVLSQSPPNDECINAISLSLPDTATEDTSLTAPGPDLPSCDTPINSPPWDVFYSVTGTGNRIRATTCSANTQYDTKITIWNDNCASPGCVLGDDDDASCLHSGKHSRAEWDSNPGQLYNIEIHGFQGDTGIFELTVFEVLDIACSPLISYNVSENLRDFNINSASCSFLDFASCAAACDLNAGCVAFNHNVYDGVCCLWVLSIPSVFNSESGTCTYVKADATLLEVLPNDRCENAIPLSLPDLAFANTTYTLNGPSLPDCNTSVTTPPRDVFYIVVGTGALLRATTCTPNLDYNSKIIVWDDDCVTPSCVAGNDDFSECPFGSEASLVEWDSNAGQIYRIQVHGFHTETGYFELNVLEIVDIVCQSLTGYRILAQNAKKLDPDICIQSDVVYCRNQCNLHPDCSVFHHNVYLGQCCFNQDIPTVVVSDPGTCTYITDGLEAEVQQDPHFYPFGGGMFDFMGEPDLIFNIISDEHLQVNSRFTQAADGLTYLGDFGVQIGRDQIKYALNNSVTLNAKEVSLQIYRLLDGGRFTVYSDAIVLEIPQYKILVLLEDNPPKFRLHVDYDRRGRVGGSSPHGILGQTTDGIPRKGTGLQGESAIVGVWEDYIVKSNDLFGTDFKFNKFLGKRIFYDPPMDKKHDSIRLHYINSGSADPLTRVPGGETTATRRNVESILAEKRTH